MVFNEIDRCDEPKRSQIYGYLTQIQYTKLLAESAVDDLANKLINFGILKETSRDDCQHIAQAVHSGCDMIVSWNFKHIVNPKTVRGVKAITVTEGYKDLLICTPSMIIEGGVFNES